MKKIPTLVETETPERAIEIARLLRVHKFRHNSGEPLRRVLDDEYLTVEATERDIAWARKLGTRPTRPARRCARSW